MKWLSNFIIGMVSGAMVGALIALLLAPGTGEETRTRIKDYGINLNDEVRSAAQEKRTALEQELARLRHPGTTQL